MNRQTLQLIVASVVTAAVLVLYVLFGYLPLSKRLEERRRILLAAEKHFAEAQELVTHYDDFLTRSLQIRMDAEDMKLRIPETAAVPELLKETSQLATSCNIKDFQFSPKLLVSQGDYALLPVQITVTCNYHALGRFVSQLATLRRLIVPDDFQITGRDKTGNTDSISAKFNMVTYVQPKKP